MTVVWVVLLCETLIYWGPVDGLSSRGMMECVSHRRQVNVGLTTYRGPGQDDPSLEGRFEEDEDEDGR